MVYNYAIVLAWDSENKHNTKFCIIFDPNLLLDNPFYMRYFLSLFFLIGLFFTQSHSQTIPEVAINQCISLDKPVYCSNTALNWSSYAALSDGDDGTILEVASPATIALQVDAQTSTSDSLILHWRAQSWENRTSNLASLKHYEIYTSHNSTDGVNGDWQFIQENYSNYKDNFVFFPNNQPKWVKVVELGTDTLKLARLEVFQNAPTGKKNDIWLFFGDSETLGTMGAGNTNYLAETRFGNQIHANNPCYYPMIINGGKGGERATEAVLLLDQILDDMRQVSIVAYAYGVNDVIFSPLLPYDDPSNDLQTATFLDAYLEIMNICNSREILPIPSRIPWVHFPNEYSTYVDTTADKTNGITPINLYEIDTIIKEFAPYAIDTTTGTPYADFETWFHEHRDGDQVYQEDFVHFYKNGVNQFNKIWVNTAQHIVYANSTCDTTGDISIACPENIYVELADTATEIVVNWASPLATSTCGMGNSVLLTQLSGDAIGSSLGIGNYYITYQAEDNCNQSDTCRFSITVRPPQEAFDCGEIDGFVKIGELSSHGYYLSENIANWKNARDSVNVLGGYLATISSQTENDLLHSALNQETAYVGIYDFLEEGQLEWANGEPVTLDLSVDNTPENDFAAINFWAGTWSLTNQWVGQKYIMEKECALVDLMMTCPSNMTIQLPIGQVDTTFLWVEPTATSLCDTNAAVLLTQVAGEPNGAILTFGEYEYTWNALDSCGNQASCNWVIMVDTVPISGELSIECPDDIHVTLPYGQTDTVLSWVAPIYATTCNLNGGITLEQTVGPPSGDTIVLGQTIVSYLATDSCGNSEDCNFVITVDSTPITGKINLECPDNMAVEVAIGKVDTILNWAEPIYSTTCNIGLDMTLTQTQGPTNGTNIPLGPSVISYMTKDSCSNEETCNFTITVTQKPDAVDNISARKNLSVSPNPVKNNLFIESTNFLGVPLEVKIFSSQGKPVFVRKQIGQNQLKIDVSTFHPGLYFIQVSSAGQNNWARFVKD